MSQEITYLTPREVSERWNGKIKENTLASWRSKGKGPKFLKLGGRVVYTLEAVKRFEERNNLDADGNEQ